MTVYNPSTHQIIFTPNGTNLEKLWGPDLTISTLKQTGLIDVTISNSAPVDTGVVWLDPNDTNVGPAVAKIYNLNTSAWETATMALLAALLSRKMVLFSNGASPPAGAVLGSFWMDPATKITYQRVNDGGVAGNIWVDINTNGLPVTAGVGNFPATPTNGQMYTTPGGYTYRYNLTKGVWDLTGTANNIIYSGIPTTGTDPILFDNLTNGIYEVQGVWTNATALGAFYDTIYLKAIRANAIDYTTGMEWDTTIYDAGTDSFVPNPTFGAIRVVGRSGTSSSPGLSTNENTYIVRNKFSLMDGRMAIVEGYTSGGSSGTEVTYSVNAMKPVLHSNNLSSIVSNATGFALDLNSPTAFLPNATDVVWKYLMVIKVG